MFSFRRKPQRAEPTPIRSRPSLPELSQGGIPWPGHLVDVQSIQQTSTETSPPRASKTSFQGDRGPIPFHKPFRNNSETKKGGISSIYMSGPPSAFDNWKTTVAPSTKQYNQRRVRQPPTFNLMVVGGQGTGKTSLLRLLLETADISPTATPDQQAAMTRFLRGPTKHTESIQTACVEICESKFDRVLLSVIDTPGLDFHESHELKLERQIAGVLKYLDTQYADTMSEESKVIRQNKGDQHIHLCIYMIDPSSVMTTAARRALSSMPLQMRSETTVSFRPPELVPDISSEDETDDETSAPLTMSPAEIRVIRRLSARSNVLPVIARADSLTDERLAAIKAAITKDLEDAGLGFGVFGPTPVVASEVASKVNSVSSPVNGKENADEESDAEGEEDAKEDRQSRAVIKLRPSRVQSGRRSQSRSRRELADVAGIDDGALSPDLDDRQSVANVRFSAHIVAKTDLSALLPFALITPEHSARRRPLPRPVSVVSGETSTMDSPVTSLQSAKNTSMQFLHSPPEDLKGVFTRKFRWGTVDVLDPNHCDFAALRTAVLSTHLKILKTHTKEVLYEKYRTEKLLARRATRNISDADRKRFLEDLGL